MHCVSFCFAALLLCDVLYKASTFISRKYCCNSDLKICVNWPLFLFQVNSLWHLLYGSQLGCSRQHCSSISSFLTARETIYELDHMHSPPWTSLIYLLTQHVLCSMYVVHEGARTHISLSNPLTKSPPIERCFQLMLSSMMVLLGDPHCGSYSVVIGARCWKWNVGEPLRCCLTLAACWRSSFGKWLLHVNRFSMWYCFGKCFFWPPGSCWHLVLWRTYLGRRA